MYSVNGVALDNPTFKWKLRAPTDPLPDLTDQRPTLKQSGLDGVVGGLPASLGPTDPVFVVETPREHLETLLALWEPTGVITSTLTPGREVAYERLAISTTGYGKADAVLDVTVKVRYSGVFWRTTAESTTVAAAIAAASVAVTGLFAGMSAPIQDAIVRVKGATTGLIVTDTAGSWFSYTPAVGAAEYLRFETASGRAFITATDTWAGGTEVSGGIDFGGSRGVFEITPRLAPGNPASRDGRLTVTTATRSGAQIQVRGRGAFIV